MGPSGSQFRRDIVSPVLKNDEENCNTLLCVEDRSNELTCLLGVCVVCSDENFPEKFSLFL
jgi:hypothetical protein